MKNKNDIRSLTLDELTSFFQKNSLPSYKAKQVYEWLWKKSCLSFDEMTNISLETRKLLKNKFVINHINIDRFQKSNDGTIKNAIALFDDLFVESVLIPTKNRTTACVSSQVGCSLDCEFCATSKMDRIRNLNPDEIYDQVVTINSQSLNYYGKPLSNIVFMGMGEPLLNYNNLIKGITKITNKEGLGISPRRITVSTSGISKMIKKMADDNVKFNLAISLHSAIEKTRNKIMPFTKNFPLEELKEAIKYWYSKTKKIRYKASLKILTLAKKLTNTPVVAIGGIKDTRNGAISSIRSAAAKPFLASRALVKTVSLLNASRLMPQPGDVPSKMP